MKVLSFKGEGRIIPHTLQDVRETLERAGHEVIIPDLSWMKQVSLRKLADLLVFEKPDLIFTVDVVGVFPYFLHALQTPPPVIMWIYDNPVTLLSRGHGLIADIAHLFLWDRAYIQPVRELGFPHVHYQPFGTNVRRNRAGAGHACYFFDVSFVGGHSPARSLCLRRLADGGIKIHVFGDPAWERDCGGNLIYAGFAANRTDCPRIYAASRINLNITSEQLLTALPVRVFDVLACGGFLLTDEREDARMLFEPGKELVIYSDVDDLAMKIRYYLAHQEERDKILDAGMKRVFADYSFDAIIPPMLERACSEHHPVPRTSGMKWPVHSLLATWLFCASCMRNGDFSEARILVDRLLSHAGTNELALAAACLHAALTGNNFLCEEFLRRLMLIHEYWEGMSGAVRSALRERHFIEWDSLYKRFAELTRSPSGN